MIVDNFHLELARKHDKCLRAILDAMRQHLTETAPDLIPLVSEGYLRHIEECEREIAEYEQTGGEHD